jgi:multiple sugar transport system substrate-binding protein
MKKSLLYILVLTLSIAMAATFTLAGCEKGGAAAAGEEEEEAEEAVVTEKAEEEVGEPVNLKFVGWEVSPLETQSVQNGLDIFMSENPNITVDYNPIPHDQYTSKILTMMMAGTCPDVFFCFAYDYRSFVKGGNLLDLTDRFNENYNIDDYITNSAEIMNVDNKVYGISSCTVSPVLYYNKDIFDAAGMDYPPSDPNEAWTWDEFRDIAKQLTIVENGDTVQYGVYGLENSYMFSALIMSNGGSYWDDNNNITKTTINTPEAAEVMQEIYDLRVVDGSSFLAAQIDPDVFISAANMLQTGRIAMLIDGSWALQELATLDFPVGVGVLPKFKEAITHGQAHVHAAWAETEHPEEAWALLNFLSGDEYQLQNVKEGLWMPNRRESYTEEGIAKWYNPDVHPEGFLDMCPYFEDALVEPTAVNADLKVNDIFTEEMGKFLAGDIDINTALANIEERANAEFAEFNAE